eukprot:6922534-Ditylum_brightwellii.AAC.1
MPCKTSKVKSFIPKSPKRNEKGEVIHLSVYSKDSKLLAMLVDQSLADNYTANSLKQEHKQFVKYANKTLDSALENACRKVSREVEVRKACSST